MVTNLIGEPTALASSSSCDLVVRRDENVSLGLKTRPSEYHHRCVQLVYLINTALIHMIFSGQDGP
jgi:hypothetical protein